MRAESGVFLRSRKEETWQNFVRGKFLQTSLPTSEELARKKGKLCFPTLTWLQQTNMGGNVSERSCAVMRLRWEQDAAARLERAQERHRRHFFPPETRGS